MSADKTMMLQGEHRAPTPEENVPPVVEVIQMLERERDQARRDVRTLLIQLRAFEEIMGEGLEGEDAAIVAAIERDYAIAESASAEK